jgi:hypothetical protein
MDSGPEKTIVILGQAEHLMRTMHEQNAHSESSSKMNAKSKSYKQVQDRVNDRRFQRYL